MSRTKSVRNVAVGTTKKSIDVKNMVLQERTPRRMSLASAALMKVFASSSIKNRCEQRSTHSEEHHHWTRFCAAASTEAAFSRSMASLGQARRLLSTRCFSHTASGEKARASMEGGHPSEASSWLHGNAAPLGG